MINWTSKNNLKARQRFFPYYLQSVAEGMQHAWLFHTFRVKIAKFHSCYFDFLQLIRARCTLQNKQASSNIFTGCGDRVHFNVSYSLHFYAGRARQACYDLCQGFRQFICTFSVGTWNKGLWVQGPSTNLVNNPPTPFYRASIAFLSIVWYTCEPFWELKSLSSQNGRGWNGFSVELIILLERASLK